MSNVNKHRHASGKPPSNKTPSDSTKIKGDKSKFICKEK